MNNTLELPLLPTLEVSVGSEWKTQNQRIDIPGLSPSRQPRVTLSNKLEALEWEGGRRTAKIHQTYEGPLKEKQIQFGPVEVDAPQVKFARDVYVAYDSGLLVRTTRSLTVTGRTTSPIGAPPAPTTGGGASSGQGFPGGGGQSMSPGFPGASSGGYPGSSSGFPGMKGSRGGQSGSGMMGGSGMMSGSGMMGGSGMMSGPGMMGGSGMMSGPGMMGMSGGKGMMSPGGMSGPGMMGGGSGASGYPGAGSDATPHKITLRSSTDTELLQSSAIGAGVDRGPRTVTTIRTTRTTRTTVRTRRAKR